MGRLENNLRSHKYPFILVIIKCSILKGLVASREFYSILMRGENVLKARAHLGPNVKIV